jgi:hypothetical protein
MIRLLSLLAVACLLATAALGCRAEGEVGDDVRSNVASPR